MIEATVKEGNNKKLLIWQFQKNYEKQKGKTALWKVFSFLLSFDRRLYLEVFSPLSKVKFTDFEMGFTHGEGEAL